MQNQENLEMPENERTKQSSSTVSSKPLWHFIPVQNVVVPLLHITLGLANNVLDLLLEWIDEMDEPMTKEEQQARTLAILAEIDLDNSVEHEHLHEESYNAKMDEREDVNAELQVCPLSVTHRDELHQHKAEIAAEIVALRDMRKEQAKTTQDCRGRFFAALQAERNIQKKRGKKEKPLQNGLFDLLWTEFGIGLSSYHGCEMEGLSCRSFMQNGADIFKKIEEYIDRYIEEYQSQVDREDGMLLGFDVGTIPTKSDINKQMDNFGSLLVLLDSVMSLLATKRGCVTQDILHSRRNSLSALKLSWYHCGLSFTPKFHVLLEHAVPFLEQTG